MRSSNVGRSLNRCPTTSVQAAGYVYDESSGRVLPEEGQERRDIKEKGTLPDIPPSQVCVPTVTLAISSCTRVVQI